MCQEPLELDKFIDRSIPYVPGAPPTRLNLAFSGTTCTDFKGYINAVKKQCGYPTAALHKNYHLYWH